MRRCKRCVMPDTRPGITFDDEGVCAPCRHVEERKRVNWQARKEEFAALCDKHRRDDGRPDCIIPVSGGKDSHYQTWVMKANGMTPLLVNVGDWFGHTKAGEDNFRNLSEHFQCDSITFRQNPDTMRRMVRLAFERLGSPTWPIDMAIYSIPLKLAHALDIPLVIYGENIAYEYGGPGAVETPSAKEQILNDVVKPIDEAWWAEQGVTPAEMYNIRYPSPDVVQGLEPIYLSYYYDWDGRRNYELMRRCGFRDASGEWEREGFIENYDQIDSYGYCAHIWMKYPKFGHARATDIASCWIRHGYISREFGMDLVRENDHKLDPKALADFCAFTGYTEDEFWSIVEKYWNRDLFEKVDGKWRMKE